jgi:serine/threonine protein kinase
LEHAAVHQLSVITEFLSGGSLRAFLLKQEHKSLPLEKIILVGLDIANGMGYLHSEWRDVT